MMQGVGSDDGWHKLLGTENPYAAKAAVAGDGGGGSGKKSELAEAASVGDVPAAARAGKGRGKKSKGSKKGAKRSGSGGSSGAGTERHMAQVETPHYSMWRVVSGAPCAFYWRPLFCLYRAAMSSQSAGTMCALSALQSAISENTLRRILRGQAGTT